MDSGSDKSERTATLPEMNSAERLAAIVESSDDAIISRTLDGIVTSWNPAAERMFGYTAKEMLGQPITILAPPTRPNEMPEILERIRRGERIDHFETERLHKDGRIIHVSLTVSPLRDRTVRLARLGDAMMQGGYRRLLLYPFRGQT